MATCDPADGNRTPSPQGGFYPPVSSVADVGPPSPIPTSISSTTMSSTVSESPGSNNHHGNSHGNSGHGGYVMSSVPNPCYGAGPGAPPVMPPPGWGSHAYESGAPGGYPHPPPHHAHHPPHPGHPHAQHPHHHAPYPQHPHHPPHHPHQHHPGSIPMIVSAPAPPSYHPHAPPPGHAPHPHVVQQQQQGPPQPQQQHPWSRENSCPNFSIGTNNDPKYPSPGRAGASKGRRRYTKANSTNSTKSNSSTKESKASKGSNKKSKATKSKPIVTIQDDRDTEDLDDDDDDDEGGTAEEVSSRRQKRLERNRESARLSRRRRKQYLEILEDRVTQLSTEVDQGRRAHAAQAVTITLHKRREIMEAPEKTDDEKVQVLQHGLGRTSAEMMLVTTFKYQQLRSFSLPAQNKFILWLTLQNDQYFRGGRAASERLSAARIGERMLNSGNDRVPPAQSMWPLFCNEVGLSYDQEERVRGFQRTLLQSEESWLERHTARASDLAMASVHDGTQAVSVRLRQRERTMLDVLTPAQKIKFLQWSENNRAKLNNVMEAKTKKHMATTTNPFVDARFKIDKNQHTAANLYVLNFRLQKMLQRFPPAEPLVTGLTLKKLSRRPSFESLGRSPMDKPGRDGDGLLSRDTSFASSGSLKRSASVMSMDSERPQLLQISPDDAEETCKPSVDKVLGHVKEIIPPTPPPQYSSPPEYACPPEYNMSQDDQRNTSPTEVASAPYHQPSYQPPYMQPSAAKSAKMQHPPEQPSSSAEPVNVISSHSDEPEHGEHAGGAGHGHGHRKTSSFIPPYLNIVPEDMFPNDGTADDFLMSLVDGDWAIGEGIDMDTSN